MLTVAAGLLGDVNAAQDTVHDVFVAFAQSPERLRLAGSLRSCLTTCVAGTQLRRSARALTPG